MALRSFLLVVFAANFCAAGPVEDLWKAIENMDPEGILAANSIGANVNHKNQYNCTPLYAAVMIYARIRDDHLGQPNIEATMERLNLVIQYLLMLGADPEGTNGHGFTALGLARDSQLTILIELLEGARTTREPPGPAFLERATSLQAPATTMTPINAPELTQEAVIHAAPFPRRTAAEDEWPNPPAPSQLHLLFAEHNPQRQYEDNRTNLHLSLQDDSEEEPIGHPGRLPPPPTLAQRVANYARAIPIAGTILGLFSSLGTSHHQ